MKALALVVLATGCGLNEDFADLPDAPIRAVMTHVHVEGGERFAELEWRAMVELAAESWNVAAESVGCTPMFRMAGDYDDAYPIWLRSRAAWEYGADVDGYMAAGGVGDHARIEVRANSRFAANLHVVTHEMGHALGLEHTDDPDEHSVMTAVNRVTDSPTTYDAESLRSASKCR